MPYNIELTVEVIVVRSWGSSELMLYKVEVILAPREDVCIKKNRDTTNIVAAIVKAFLAAKVNAIPAVW